MIRMTDRCCSYFLDKRVGITKITLHTVCYRHIYEYITVFKNKVENNVTYKRMLL